MFKVGDIAYFKKARKTTGRKGVEGIFKGYGIGVFMGHVPPGRQDLMAHQVRPIFAQIGFVSFDDVSEFLGEKACAEVLKKFEAKYYEPQKDDKQPELPLEGAQPEGGKIIEIKRPTAIVGLNGKPFGG